MRRFRGRYAKANNGMELKFHDLATNDGTITANNVMVLSCNLIPQGVTECQRVGRKCTIKNIGWRFTMKIFQTTVAGDTSEVIRVILYVDKQCNGATAAITDLLETDSFQSFNNLSNKSRFRTLMDRTYALHSTAGGTSAAGVHQVFEQNISDSFYKKMNLPIEFSGINGVIGEIRSNNIGILILVENGGFSKFTGIMRLRFSDG